MPPRRNVPERSILDMDHQTFMPPSTTMSTPVTYELSSDARNSATFATSSGRPRRPNNVLPSIATAHSGSFSCARVWLVSISEGRPTALAVRRSGDLRFDLHGRRTCIHDGHHVYCLRPSRRAHRESDVRTGGGAPRADSRRGGPRLSRARRRTHHG